MGEIREPAAPLPNTEVVSESDGSAVHIVVVTQPRRETRVERIVRRLRGSATTETTTDEILALTRGEA